MLDYELILLFGAAGYMWSEVLTREGMIFGWVPGVVRQVIKQGHPLEKPLFSCAVCITGFWVTLTGFLYASSSGAFTLVNALEYALMSMLVSKILLRYA